MDSNLKVEKWSLASIKASSNSFYQTEGSSFELREGSLQATTAGYVKTYADNVSAWIVIKPKAPTRTRVSLSAFHFSKKN